MEKTVNVTPPALLEHFGEEEVPKNEQKRVRVEVYNGHQVSLYEIDGREYITGENIGRCLGLADPRRSVQKIYSRNREELDAHKGVVKLATPGGPQEITVFTETGANLIAMFSRTAEAKAFRLWLARLPKQVRQFESALPEALGQVFEKGRKTGVSLALRLLACPAVAKLGLEGVSELVWARQRGDTQAEAGKRLGISKDLVRDVEKALKELGIYFAAVSGKKRKREMRQSLAYALGEISPVLPGPELDA